MPSNLSIGPAETPTKSILGLQQLKKQNPKKGGNKQTNNSSAGAHLEP